MEHKPIIIPRYEMTYYDSQGMETKYLSGAEIKDIDPQGFDFFMSQSQAIWGYRNIEGQWIEHHIHWPGLGNSCIKIMHAAQLNPWVFLPPREIADLTGINSLAENNNLSARWLAIRKAHGESFLRPHFWLSRRAGGMAVAWNPNCTWLWLERIPVRHAYARPDTSAQLP